MGKDESMGNFFEGCDPHVVQLLMSDDISNDEKEKIFKSIPQYKIITENYKRYEESIINDYEEFKKLIQRQINNK